MAITISGSPDELAALVVALQGRQSQETTPLSETLERLGFATRDRLEQLRAKKE